MKSKIAFFDPYSGGHHPEHLAYLIEEWTLNYQVVCSLEVITTQANLRLHTKLMQWFNHPPEGLSFYLIAELQATSLFKKNIEQGNLLTQYIRSKKPDHVFCLFFDHLQIALVQNLKFNYPVTFSGIYFRAMWHYGQWHDISWKDQIRAMRQKVLLHAALRNRHFSALFCFDPYIVPILQKNYKRSKQIVALPEPFSEQVIEHTNTLKEWTESGKRKRLLLTGVLDERKGVLALLKALALLDTPTLQQLSIVLAGKLDITIQNFVTKQISELRLNGLEIILQNGFIPYESLAAYVQASNVVLIPYQNHVGSSGLLIRAAKATKPVISQHYGLMGQWVRENKLGLAVNTCDPTSLASGIREALAGRFSFSPASNAFFAQQHSTKDFVNVIWKGIMTSVSEHHIE